MKKALLKDSLKEIKVTYRRFISILVMSLLGVGFFAGIKATSPDMRHTLDNYFDNLNVYDIQVLSTLGLTNEDVQEIQSFENIENVYGAFSTESIINIGEKEIVAKIIGLNENGNNIVLIDGKLPENNKECVVEQAFLKYSNKKIGDSISIEEKIEEDEDSFFKEKENITIVGSVESPLYISRERGTTKLGNGKISYYMYMPESNMNSEVYTEIYITAKNAKEMICETEEYEDYIDDIIKNIDNIKEKRQQVRYDNLISEANKKLDDAQSALDKEKAEAQEKIADAGKKLQDGKSEIENGEKEVVENTKKADKEFADAQKQIDDAYIKLQNQEREFNTQKANAEDGFTEAENKKIKLKNTLDELTNGISMLQISLVEINEQISFIEKSGMNAQLSNLQTQKQNIETTISSYNMQKEQIVLGIKEIENQISNGRKDLEAIEVQIKNGYVELQKNQEELNSKKAETYLKLNNAKKEIEDAKKELTDAEIELNNRKQEADDKIKDAENKLVDARQKVSDIENPTWYIFDRTNNTGYKSFSQDIDSIAALGSLFPIVFFIIATLISLTTMTRMVEEQRTLIGTFKALGYSNKQIAMKYILYSSFATIIGGFVGCIIGFQTLPRIIFMLYGMMYTLEDIYIEFNITYALIGIITIGICIIGATIYSVYKELFIEPAELMRPKSPKSGKRVWLEKIPFIWNRFDFIQKVTIRNMFRYKKRFLMTIIGICGCTALILTGFGIKDSISNILGFQYGEIYSYDLLIALKDSVTEEEKLTLINQLKEKEEIEECYETYMASAFLKSEKSKEEVNIIVPKDTNNIEGVIKLKDRKNGEILNLTDDSIIITDKVSDLLGISVGDKLKYIDSDEKETEVVIGGIVEHYLMHYVYMSPNLYEKIYNEKYKTNVILTDNKLLTEEKEAGLVGNILQDSKVMSISKTSDAKSALDDTLSLMNYVVWVLIISAGLLAFVVLYNLSNINISERIRELATIKVLGFYDKEVYNYVTREIIMLTIIGIILGLGGGYLLTRLVLVTCEINILRFTKVILPISYIYSVLITIIFTIIVNFVTYFSLKKIDMIDALKSVE